MSTTCLISNYNYAHFLGDAVGSALGQTVPFDQIIVVDDGSTDGSLNLLTDRYRGQANLQVVAKQNEGQLSCFNEGFARAIGDIVFFLDADDVYEPNYVEQALEVYDRDQSHDFLFCGYRQFGDRDHVKAEFPEDRDLGYSVVLAAYLREWIGGPTSCLSMRRRVLEKILPLPFIEDWRTRADDCLVFGGSLVGARKYYLAQTLVNYRVHSSNQFCGRRCDKFATYRRRLAVNALFEHLERKLCYDVPRLAEIHHREFRTIAKPTFRQLRQYCRIGASSRASLFRRAACIAEMAGYYLRTSMTPVRRAGSAAALTEQEPTTALHVFRPAADPAPSLHTRPLKQHPPLAA